MRSSKIFAVVFAAFILSFPKQADLGQRKEAIEYTVKGRVVDDAGIAVPGTLVALLPSHTIDGYLVIYRETDADARFRIEDSLPEPSERVLFVITDYPRDAYAPIAPPFTSLHRLDQSFVGIPVSIRGIRELDLGDVLLQVRYGTVILEFQNHKGRPIFSGGRTRQGIWVRIRDRRGDIVSENALSAEELRRINSGLKLALPEGEWQVEASFEADNMVWQPLDSRLVILRSNKALRTTLTLAAHHSRARLPVINESPEGARQQLERLNVPLNGESLIERAKTGNTIAVQRLLIAGIDPNARGEHDTTALIRDAARGFSDIVSALLARGADVNARESNGATALVAAAGSGNSNSVKILLKNKADMNASTRDGITPLMMAVANNKPNNVKHLLRARADLNLKDVTGRTALTWAIASGHPDIAELLKVSGAKE